MARRLVNKVEKRANDGLPVSSSSVFSHSSSSPVLTPMITQLTLHPKELKKEKKVRCPL